MSERDLLTAAAFFALIGVLLFRNLPGALMFVRPGWIRQAAKGGPDAVGPEARGPAMTVMLDDLLDAGFQPLGLLEERRPLSRAIVELVFIHEEVGCFAGVRPIRNEAWLTLSTPFRDGALVTTSDFRLPSVDEDDYLAGGLPGSGPHELLNAHRRRVQRFVDAGREVDDRLSLEAREEVGRRFYTEGPGRREIRRKEIKAMAFSSIALIWTGSFIVGLIRNLG